MALSTTTISQPLPTNENSYKPLYGKSMTINIFFFIWTKSYQINLLKIDYKDLIYSLKTLLNISSLLLCNLRKIPKSKTNNTHTKYINTLDFQQSMNRTIYFLQFSTKSTKQYSMVAMVAYMVSSLKFNIIGSWDNVQQYTCKFLLFVIYYGYFCSIYLPYLQMQT